MNDYKTVDDILTEAKQIGEATRLMLDSGEPQNALEHKLKEIDLLEYARKQFPQDGRPVADLGEAYTTVSKIYRETKETGNSDFYLHKAKNAFRSIFNSDKFPRFSYDSYSFVLWHLASNTKDNREKYALLEENVRVLEKAIKRNVYVGTNKLRLKQTKLALTTLKQQKYLKLPGA